MLIIAFSLRLFYSKTVNRLAIASTVRIVLQQM